MIGFRRHPAYRELSEFSDGTLEAGRLARVSSHLERCSACRSEVGTIRDADGAMRDVPIPPMPEDLLERVLERRDSDIRTLVPTTGPARPMRRRPAPRVLAGLAAIAVLAIGVGVFTREAGAGASSLAIDATGAAAAIPLDLDYRPGAALRDESEVVVRARIWRTGSSGSVIRTVGTLARDGKAFEGEALLPPDAVFALMAVEDPSGERIDVNGGDFWEYVEGGAVAPTPAARAARLDALETLSMEGLVSAAEVRVAAVSATLAAPGDIDLWDRRLSLERHATTDSARYADILEFHRGKLRDLEGLARSPEDYASLVNYAAQLAEPEAGARLLRRLETLDPDHEMVFRERLRALMANAGSPDAGFPDGFEALWRDIGSGEARSSEALELVATVALRLAYTPQDPEAIERWARRLFRLSETARDEVVGELAGRPGLEALTIALARSRLEQYETVSDVERPLHQSRQAFAATVADRRAGLLAAMGRALLAQGKIERGREKLQESLSLRWDPLMAKEFLDLEVPEPADETFGWTTSQLATLLEADPLSTGRHSGGVVVEDEARQARRDLADRLVRGVPTGEAPAAAFRSRVGREVPIDDGGVSVIALWRAVPGSNHEDFRMLEDLTPRLVGSGVRVLFAVPESSLDDAVAFAADVGARPVVDDAGIATDGFGNWYAQAYVVVHEGWYSVHYDFEDAARLALLRSEE